MMPGLRSGQGWSIPLAAGVIVLLLTGIATWQLQARLDALAGQRLDQQLDATAREVGDRLARAGDLVAGIAALEAGSEEVTPDELATFLTTISRQRPLGEAFPGVTGVLMLDATAAGGLELRQGVHTIGDADRAIAGLEACVACGEVLVTSRNDDGQLEALLLGEDLARAFDGQVLLVEALADEPLADEPPADEPPADEGLPAAGRWAAVSVDLPGLALGIDGPQVVDVVPGAAGTPSDDPDATGPPAAMAREAPLERRTVTSYGTDFVVTMTRPDGLLTGTERLAPWALAVAGMIVSALIVALLRSATMTRSRALAAVDTATADQRSAIDQLGEANRRLSAANEELERFAGVVAHDLRAPLSHIEGLVEVVRSGRATEGDASAILDRALANTVRLQRLIDDLLEYAAAGRTIGERGPVDLTVIAEEAVERLTATIDDSGATVTVDRLPRARGDAERLLQVFQNVIGNAVRHAATATGPRVEVTGRQEGSRVIVTIADDGPGIPPSERTRVLSAFERGEQAERDGTGLGLATVVRIVEAHDGRLTLGDAPTGGLAVHIELPAG